MADNLSDPAPLVSSQVTPPHDPSTSATDRQLHSLLQEQIANVKQQQQQQQQQPLPLHPPGASIPRLLSPAPIGTSGGSGDSTASSQRASPVPILPPPPSTSKSPQFDLDLPQNGSQPSTPKRTPGGISRGLSLQLPANAGEGVKTPLTPKLDPAISYGSPASVLPRRSRGMDFSRAATHLHHSTIAEKPDPESSPIVGGRGISVPRRTAFDSPMRNSGNNCGFEQSAISSSVGSISMMDSGSDSSSDDDIAMRDEEDTLLTPQVSRMGMGLGGFSINSVGTSPGGEAIRQFAATDGRIYRDRLRSKGSRKNSETKRSSNGWKYDWLASPGLHSPPVHRSIEGSESYFQREISRRNMQSRRESLSLGTDELTIDDTTPGSDENRNSADVLPGAGNSAEGRKDVIKRAVTARRSQLIPKSKGFARIRAALMEENAPIDVENRREAEVIRQVKERDEEHKPEESHGLSASQPATTASSPCLAPAPTAGPTDSPDDMSEINLEPNGPIPSTRRSSSSFSVQASKHGAGTEFWSRFLDDDRLRTPPPPLFHGGSSAVSVFSEDASMSLETSSGGTSAVTGPPPLWPGNGNGNEASRNGSSGGGSNSGGNNNNNSQSQGNSSQQQHLLQAGNNPPSASNSRNISPSRGRRSNTPTTAAIQTSAKALGKRRRDDELDAEFFKRRAVSPGLSSIAGSPILPPSPAQRENSWWSTSTKGGSGDSYGGGGNNGNGNGSGNGNGKKETPAGHVAGERLGSASSEGGGRQNSSGRGMERRVGLQGMNEAGEGMMNMSIE